MPLALIAIITSAQTLIVSLVKGKAQKILFWGFPIAEYVLFGVQTVYFTVFRQPLQFRAAVVGGQDALTNYWREAFSGFLKALPLVLLSFLPLLIMIVLMVRKKWKLKPVKSIQKVRICFGLGVSVLLFYVVMNVGRYNEAEFYDEYSEFYAPLSVVETMGVVTMVQRDLFYEAEVLLAGEDGSVMGQEDK